MTRREWLWTAGGIAGLALAEPQLPVRARAVISIFCYGGVSHVDTFDPKPELLKRQGEALPGEVATSDGLPGGLMPSPWSFARHGASGIEVSALFPQLARHVDEMAFIRSMHASSGEHATAMLEMSTGFAEAGHPSLGSWVSYRLGRDFVVLTDSSGLSPQNWGSGHLPAIHQGTGTFRLSPERRWLEALRKLNEEHLRRNPEDADLAARMDSYERAYHLEAQAVEAMDVSKESAATQQLYGFDRRVTRQFARHCLTARRLVERGVRFVEIFAGGWDAHVDLKANHELHAAEVDQPLAALLEDLKGRGLLESTVVLWQTEFGRLPIAQRVTGRDHNPLGFTVWLSGGGVRGGTVVGATDEFGYRAVEKRKSVNDLHATVLYLLGLKHGWGRAIGEIIA